MTRYPIELLTAAEAAARLKMCERTLRRLRQKGAIPYYETGGRSYSYSVEDCDNYLASRRRQDEAPCPHPSNPPIRRTGSTTSRSASVGFMAQRAARKAKS